MQSNDSPSTVLSDLAEATTALNNTALTEAVALLIESYNLPKPTQESLGALYQKVEACYQSDRVCGLYLQTVQAVFPVLAVGLVGLDARKEHVQACVDSMQYYINRLGKEGSKAWISAIERLPSACLADPRIAAPSIHSSADSTAANKKTGSGESTTEPVLEGNRWYVRKCQQDHVQINAASLGQAVVIQDCSHCTVTVASKCAAIFLDGCQRVRLEIEGGVLSDIELVKCRQCVVVVVTGSAKTVVLDQCEAVQIVAGHTVCAELTLLTSQCAEINVLLEDGTEMPVPVQFKTTIDSTAKILTTAPVNHVGA